MKLPQKTWDKIFSAILATVFTGIMGGIFRLSGPLDVWEGMILGAFFAHNYYGLQGKLDETVRPARVQRHDKTP